ncbi:MAG: macro domain-containing protein, partial [Thermoanaerobaculia bacterium]|nr:macro domain-containing protein [Thermoanaerobaculia bacterium]
TTSGNLEAKAVIHCVASDSSHDSSAEIVRSCTSAALKEAVVSSCRSIAIPVFATGHAALRFEEAVDAISEVIAGTSEPIDEVFIAVLAPDRVAQARAILDRRY